MKNRWGRQPLKSRRKLSERPTDRSGGVQGIAVQFRPNPYIRTNENVFGIPLQQDLFHQPWASLGAIGPIGSFVPWFAQGLYPSWRFYRSSGPVPNDLCGNGKNLKGRRATLPDIGFGGLRPGLPRPLHTRSVPCRRQKGKGRKKNIP